jgi:pyruvate/2-oxoglutarate dehydrogenase complex dihydrolipoamide acyltransferase (E2) component
MEIETAATVRSVQTASTTHSAPLTPAPKYSPTRYAPIVTTTAVGDSLRRMTGSAAAAGHTAPTPASAAPAPTAPEKSIPAAPAPPKPVAAAPQAPFATPPVPGPATSTVEEPSDALTPDEARLTNEIDQLWYAHCKAQGTLHKSREGAAQMRAELSKRLHELKSVLSRPGRGGAWFSFLKVHAIPRSTADRLVNAHEKTISGAAENCPIGASKEHEPTDIVVRRCLNGLWPKLSRVLTTAEHLEMFVAELTKMAKKSFGADDEASSSSVSEGAAATL